MSSRKQSFSSLWAERDKHCKSREPHNFIPNATPNFFLFLCLVAWLFVLFSWLPSLLTSPSGASSESSFPLVRPRCDLNVSVYVYDLPAEFNRGLLVECRHLSVYTDMCPHVANCGLGQPVSGSGGAWFATHQFLGEMIFHARMENHPCQTRDPEKASLFYVPFYGGLHASSKFREGNHTLRDELVVRLVGHLRRQPAWKRRGGRDHFLALGRTAWDFMRSDTTQDFGANVLLNLPPVRNMSVLTVERHPWQGSNQHGIPYPSYFHPSTAAEMRAWQRSVGLSHRPYLFSFIGGTRKGVEKAAVRDEIIRQCRGSTQCRLVECRPGASQCHRPADVLAVMMASRFCLQAPGDSFTRRSTFDSVLAGCIPVFFSPHTAYTQYAWFLPEDTVSYSVFIDGERLDARTSIEAELSKISGDTVEKMRNRVVDLIPSLTYSHPNATDAGFRDAVDVALDALSKHVASMFQSSL